MSRCVLPMFSSKSLRVFGLTFGCLNHLEFIFLCGVMEYFVYLFFTCSFPVFSAPFIEETISSPPHIFAFYVRVHKHRHVGLSLNFLPCFMVQISIFVPVPYCFKIAEFQYSLISGHLIPLVLFIFLKIAFAIPYKLNFFF